MKIIAIDPGCTESAWVHYHDGKIVTFGKDLNENLLEVVKNTGIFDDTERIVCEMIASYGMPVGKEVFETCVWIGRFLEASPLPHTLVYRKDVKMHLCGSMRAKDSNIRQALIDRYGAPGTKSAPGGTYGISKDVWAALAVATCFSDKQSSPGQM